MFVNGSNNFRFCTPVADSNCHDQMDENCNSNDNATERDAKTQNVSFSKANYGGLKKRLKKGMKITVISKTRFSNYDS